MATVLDDPNGLQDAEQALLSETAADVRALRARLAAARDRATAADQRRRQLFADHAESMDGRYEDVRKLEDTISHLTGRARDYNRALNEAATLVDEMDGRILYFRHQLAAMQDMLSTAGPSRPEAVRRPADVTESSVAADLDVIRQRGSDVMRLKHHLDQILAG